MKPASDLFKSPGFFLVLLSCIPLLAHTERAATVDGLYISQIPLPCSLQLKQNYTFSPEDLSFHTVTFVETLGTVWSFSSVNIAFSSPERALQCSCKQFGSHSPKSFYLRGWASSLPSFCSPGCILLPLRSFLKNSVLLECLCSLVVMNCINPANSHTIGPSLLEGIHGVVRHCTHKVTEVSWMKKINNFANFKLCFFVQLVDPVFVISTDAALPAKHSIRGN